MTAKLPPKWVPINLMQLNATQLRHVQAYADTFALQAVRDALERAEQRLESHMDYEAGAVVRAMIEEYK